MNSYLNKRFKVIKPILLNCERNSDEMNNNTILSSSEFENK